MSRIEASGPRYRRDIDGLRTLAVVPVVLYHAGVPGFSGGFVGVDIFFVISGYLITQLLVADFEADRFSIATFYERRVRRIFPALTVVLGFCLAVGYVIFDPANFARLGKSAGFVALFLSNFFFWKEVDYFTPAAHGDPLIHTWSLAVEEQFYIFYPLFLLFLLRRNWPLRRTLLVVAAGSLAAAVLLLPYKPSATFYLLPTRAWELLAGGWLAVGPARAAWTLTVQRIGSLAGICLLALPIMLYDDNTPFPGLAAMVPVAGAMVLIGLPADERDPVKRLLAWEPMVLVGQASYSFYLWHVPLLSFARYLRGGSLSLPAALAICAVSLIVALVSLRWIERPFRRPRRDRRYRALAVGVPVAAMVACAGAALAIVQGGGLPARLDPAAQRLVAAQADRQRHHFECMSNGDRIVPPGRACRLGTADAVPRLLLWGDSHAAVTASAIELAAKRKGGSFLFAASADCPPGLGFSISETTEPVLTTTPSYRYCDDYNRAMFDLATRDPQIATVVISSRWTNWRIGEPANPAESDVDLRLRDDTGVAASVAGNRAIFERGFIRLLTGLTRAGKQVVLVGPIPEPTVSVPEALFVERFGFAPRLAPIPVSAFTMRHARIADIFARVAAAVPGIRIVHPEVRLCDKVSCPVIVAGRPVYFDHNHLSVDAARRTADLYEPLFAQTSSPSDSRNGEHRQNSDPTQREAARSQWDRSASRWDCKLARSLQVSSTTQSGSLRGQCGRSGVK